MALRIEDYAVIGNCETAALVGRDGSIDWLCIPRFDSAACFAALLGTAEHGRWLIAPAGPVRAVRRRYRPGTLILETEFETADGVVVLSDCMPIGAAPPALVRMVEGTRGAVPMRIELAIRLDFGSRIPWVRRQDDGIRAIGGPDALRLWTPVPVRGRTSARWATSPWRRASASPSRSPGIRPKGPTQARPPASLIDETETWWRDWSGRCTYEGPEVPLALRVGVAFENTQPFLLRREQDAAAVGRKAGEPVDPRVALGELWTWEPSVFITNRSWLPSRELDHTMWSVRLGRRRPSWRPGLCPRAVHRCPSRCGRASPASPVASASVKALARLFARIMSCSCQRPGGPIRGFPPTLSR